MMQSSSSQGRSGFVERRLGREDQITTGDSAPLLLLLLLCGAILSALAMASASPFGDSGGYEAMLRHFLLTGRVDYMKWSQPTFIGLLPIAVPWAAVVGTSTASLQWLSVAFSLALAAGVWTFCRRTVGGWAAFWIALCVLLLHEALSSSATFMTDVPYAAYLVWFLIAHRELEARHTSSGQGAAGHSIELWIVWSVLFLLSALTRSFSLILVPVFALQWLLSRRGPSRDGFAIRCLLLGLALSLLSIAIVRQLGVNGFSPREITAIPLILGGDRGRLNLRALLSGLLGLAVAILPALLLWSAKMESTEPVRARALWRGISLWDAIIGVLALGISLLFWRKGTLNSLVSLPQFGSIEKLMLLVQAALAVVAVPLLARVLVRAWRASVSLGARRGVHGVHGEEARPAFLHTSGVLLAIVMAHFALMPILLHPLARHLMPAGVALLLLVALQGAPPLAMSRPSRLKAALGSALTLLLLPAVVLGVACDRALNQKQFNVAAQMNRSGVPVSRIAAGWAFFCARDLRPGLAPSAYLPPNDYVSRFNKREERAPYIVTTDRSVRGQQISVHPVPLILGPDLTVRALKRAPAPARKAAPRLKKAAKKAAPR